MKTTSLLLLCCLLCLAVFTDAHNKKGGKPKQGRGHSRSDSDSDSSSDSSSDSDSRCREHGPHHKRCPRLQALTWDEVGYVKTYDKSNFAQKPIALGEATFHYHPNGEIEATCKCKSANVPGYNTVCQFQYDKGYESFYSQNATSLNVNGDKNGHFDVVKTKGVLKINCDKKKGQIRVNGTALTHYACFSAVYKYDCKAAPTSVGVTGSCKRECPELRSLSWEELVKYSNTWANRPDKLQPIALGKTSFKSTTAGGLEVTCRCKPAKGKNNFCALEFDNGFDSYWTKNSTSINKNNNKNGHFDVIESKDFVSIKCDSSTGNILVNGTALTNYVCYSGHFINDCTVSPTGNDSVCTKRHSNSGSSSSSESSGSNSNSDQSD